MTATIRYYISGNNADFLDLQTSGPEYSLKNQQIVVGGTAGVNTVRLAPGITLDAQGLLGGQDVLIFDHRWDEYKKDITSIPGAIVLTHNDPVQGDQRVLVLNGATAAGRDRLVFLDGTVLSNHAYAGLKTSLQVPLSQVGSVDTQTTSKSISIPSPAGNTLSVFASLSEGHPKDYGAVFAMIEPGQPTTLMGSAQVDSVYVKAGAKVDARNLLSGQDIIYFTGTWADYAKNIKNIPGSIQFTRTVPGVGLEVVTVLNGATTFGKDQWVFADGSVLSQNARVALQSSLSIPISEVSGYAPEYITPFLSDILRISVNMGESEGLSDNYANAGDILVLDVFLKSAARLDTTQGTPVLDLNIGDKTFSAQYDPVKTTSKMMKFRVEVPEGVNDLTGLSFKVNPIRLQGSTLKFIDTQADVQLGFPKLVTNLLVDTQAPEAISMALSDDSGASSEDGITNNPLAILQGVNPGHTSEYQVDDGEWTSSIDNTFLLFPGKHVYAVRQIDMAGNPSPIARYTHTFLDFPPEIILSLARTNGVLVPGSLISDTDFFLAGKALPEMPITIQDAEGKTQNLLLDSEGKWSIPVHVDMIVLSGVSNTALNTTYHRVTDVTSLQFSRDFTPGSGETIVDTNKPVYQATIKGESWYLWARVGSGYHLSRLTDTREWYWEDASNSMQFGGSPSEVMAVGNKIWHSTDNATRVQSQQSKSVLEKNIFWGQGAKLSYTVSQTDLAGNSTEIVFPITVDGASPTILDLDITTYSSDGIPKSDLLVTGDKIRIDVTLSEAVEVVGDLRYALSLDADQRDAILIDGNGSHLLSFEYVVAEGDMAFLVMTSLADMRFPPQTSVRDLAGRDITFASVPEFISSTISVDARTPTVLDTQISKAFNPDNTFPRERLSIGDSLHVTVTASEPLMVLGEPIYTITIDGKSKQAKYLEGSGTDTLVFSYTLVAGDSGAEAVVSIPANPFVIPAGSSIKNEIGNPLNLLIPNPENHSGSIPTDVVPPHMAHVALEGYDNQHVAVHRPLGLGDIVRATVRLSEEVVVSGDPAYIIDTAGTEQRAQYVAEASRSDSLVFEYTITSDHLGAQGIASPKDLGLILGQDASIRDIAGNFLDLQKKPSTETSDPILLDLAAPHITGIDITGYDNVGTPKQSMLIFGDKIRVTVTVSEKVSVLGTPAYTIHVGGVDRQARYVSGGGSNQLIFEYSLGKGDIDEHGGITAGAAGLVGTEFIRDIAANPVIAETQEVLENSNSITVDARIPTVTHIDIAGFNSQMQLKEGLPLVAGDKISVVLTLSNTVTVQGIPSYLLDLGGVKRHAAYVSGNGSNKLVFEYVVSAGDTTSGLGVSAGTSALRLFPSQSIQDAFGNQIDEALPSLDSSNNSVVVEASILPIVGVPTVLSVRIEGLDATGYSKDVSLLAGEKIRATVKVSEAVTVTGIPSYTIDLGGVPKRLLYVSGSGTDHLVFELMVKPEDLDQSGGVTALVNALNWEEATIASMTTGTHLSEKIPAVLAGNNIVSVDAQAPKVTSVRIEGYDPSGVVKHTPLLVGDTISIVLESSEPLIVNNINPTYTIDVGGNLKQAGYVGSQQRTDNTRLIFSYVVSPQDLDSAGGIISDEKALKGIQDGAIQDFASNSLKMLMPVVSPGTNTIAVDTKSPNVIGVDISGYGPGNVAKNKNLLVGDTVHIEVDISEPVLVQGNPTYTIDVGGSTRQAQYVQGSGSKTLLFEYLVALGDIDTLGGITAGAKPFSVPESTYISDFAGNSLVFSAPEVLPFSNSVKIDTEPLQFLSLSVNGFSDQLVPKNDFLLAGDRLRITLSTSKFLSADDSLSYPIRIGTVLKQAVCISSGETKNLVFEYVIRSGDVGSIQLVDGLTFSDLGSSVASIDMSNSDLMKNLPIAVVPKIAVDAQIPSITKIQMLGYDGSTNVLKNTPLAVGDKLSVELDVSEPIVVFGNPNFLFTAAGNLKTARYNETRSLPNRLVMEYTVADKDVAPQGTISSTRNALNLSGDTVIADVSGNLLNLDIPVVPVGTKNVVLEGHAPRITQVTVSGVSSTGVLKASPLMPGEIVRIDLVADNPLVVKGTPVYKIDVAGVVKQAAYVGGSGTNTLTFEYIVDKDLGVASGIGANKTALMLGSGVIKDVRGNLLDLVVPVLDPRITKVAIDTQMPSSTKVVISGYSAFGDPKSDVLGVGDKIRVFVSLSETVTVSGAPTYTINVGGIDYPAAYVAGSGSSNLFFEYTVASGDSDTVGGIRAASNALVLNAGASIKDSAGNTMNLAVPVVNSGSNTVQVDTIAPIVSSVSIAGYSADNLLKTDPLLLGEIVRVTVYSNKILLVSGTPTFAIEIGGKMKQAVYTTGSGSNKLVFEYLVIAGDYVDRSLGVTAPSSSISFGTGGKIQDTIGNTLNTVSTDVPVHANLLGIDTVPPSILSLAISGSDSNGNTVTRPLMPGDKIRVSAIVSEPVHADGMSLYIGVGGVEKTAQYVRGSGSDKLIFEYVVTTGDYAGSEGITSKRQEIIFSPRGFFKDIPGNALVSSSVAAVASGTNAVHVDTVPPSVSSVRITGLDMRGHVKQAPLVSGDKVRVEVTLSEAVLVTGAPSFTIILEDIPSQATWVSGSGTTDLVFEYTLSLGDTDTVGGVTATPSAIFLNQGSKIRDLAGNLWDSSTLIPPVNAGSNSLKVYTIGPKVVQASIDTFDASGAAKEEGLVAGDKIWVILKTSDVVYVTGTPSYALQIGSDIQHAAYIKGSGTDRLVFQYVVSSGDQSYSNIGVTANKNAMNINVLSSIKDVAGNDLDPVMPQITAGSNSVIVDALVPIVLDMPTVQSVLIEGVHQTRKKDLVIVQDVIRVTLGVSEPVWVVGRPVYKIYVGGKAKQADYVSGNGSDQLVFEYRVVTEDVSEVGSVVASADALDLKTASIVSVDTAVPLYQTMPVVFPGNNIVAVDGIEPKVLGVLATGYSGATGKSKVNALLAGDKVQLELTMSKPVVVTGKVGYAIEVGTKTVQADYVGGSGTTQLLMEYTVSKGDIDALGGVTATTRALTIQGDSAIQDLAGNRVQLGVPAILSGTNSLMIDAQAPEIINVAMSGHYSSGVGKTSTLINGDKIRITLNTSEPVHISGNPFYLFTLAGVSKKASYVSGSGTASLLFEYAIEKGDAAKLGDLSASDKALVVTEQNGIRDFSGNLFASTIPPVSVGKTSILVDAQGPIVQSVSIAGYHKDEPDSTNPVFRAGDIIHLTLHANESMIVSGNPTYSIDVGGIQRQVPYLDGSGTSELVFDYTIPDSDLDTEGGITASDSALLLKASESIRDLVGNPIDLKMPVIPVNANQIGVDAQMPLINFVQIEALDQGNNPKNSTLLPGDKIRVRVFLSETVYFDSLPPLTLQLSSGLVQAQYARGSGTNELLFEYSVAQQDMNGADGIVIQSFAFDLVQSPVRDAAGNLARSPWTVPDIPVGKNAITVDGVLPQFTSTTIAGYDSANVAKTSTLLLGNKIRVTLLASEPVVLNGSSPSFTVFLGAVPKQANYIRGTGSNTLVFEYVIANGDVFYDSVGITASANALNVPVDGTIKDTTGNLAILNVPPVSKNSNVMTVDAQSPTITGVTIAGCDQANVLKNTPLVVGDKVFVTLSFSEPISFTGQASYAINLGGVSKNATYVSGQGSTQIVFAYTVVAGDMDLEGGIQALSSAFNLSNQGIVKDFWGNLGKLTVPEVAVGSNAVVIDALTPVVVSVDIYGYDGDTGTIKDTFLRAGDKVRFTLELSEPVTVQGAPTYAMDIGGVPKYARYLGGSGTNHLVFEYTISNGDTDLSGGITAGGFALSSGDGSVIQDRAGNLLSRPIPWVEAGSNNLSVDTQTPNFTGMTIAGYSGGILKTKALSAGDKINLTLSVSEKVLVEGNPVYDIQLGDRTQPAIYASGSGTNKLTFEYVVSAGDFSAAGGITADSKNLHISDLGYSIQDFSGNPVNMQSVPALLAGGSNKVAVNAVVPVPQSIPTVQSVSIEGIDAVTHAKKLSSLFSGDVIRVTLYISESVSVNASPTAIPTYTLFLGGQARDAVYVSGGGSQTLMFEYVVAPGDNSALGQVTSLSNAINLQIGTILSDLSSIPLNLTIPVVFPGSNSLVVDSLSPTVLSAEIVGYDSMDMPSNANLFISDKVRVLLSFSEPVQLLGGVPTYGIQVGGVRKEARYVSGKGTRDWVFEYIVSEGDVARPGEIISIDHDSFSGDGVVIQDFSKNPLDSQKLILSFENKLSILPPVPSMRLFEDTGRSNTDGITSNPIVQVSRLIDGGVWEYSLDAGAQWTQGTGSTFALPSGTYSIGTIGVRQKNVQNVWSEAQYYESPLTIDPYVSGPGIRFTVDSGISTSDWVTNNGEIRISTLEKGATWEYSQDYGKTWTAGVFGKFVLSNGMYPVGMVQTRQTDIAGNTSSSQNRTMLVLDTVAPIIQSSSTAYVDENSAAGTVVYKVLASDAASSNIRFSLNPSYSDQKYFAIDASSGVVVINISPDFETKNSYSLSATALDDAGNSAECPISLFVNNLFNETVSLTPSTFSIGTGKTQVLTLGMLGLSSGDLAPTAVTVEVKNLIGAEFLQNGLPTTSFKLSDVSASKITFHHIVGGVPSFGVGVSLPDGTVLPPVSSRITLLVPPVSLSPKMNIQEGETLLITNDMLNIRDPDSSDGDITIRVLESSHGVFQCDGLVKTQFTLADVKRGSVVFVHDGGEIAPTVQFSLFDGLHSSATYSPELVFQHVDDPTVVRIPKFSLYEGESIGITPEMISVSDPDTDVSSAVFQVGNVLAGYFETTGASRHPITHFTQTEILNGSLRFTHTGSEEKPVFTLYAILDEKKVGAAQSNIQFTYVDDAPNVTQPKLLLKQGASIQLDNKIFEITDPDTPSHALNITVEQLKNGVFQKSGEQVTEFRLADIEAGLISFKHDGSITKPTFAITVADTAHTIGPVQSQITFIQEKNNPPMMKAPKIIVEFSGQVTLTLETLGISDVDSADSAVILDVSEVTGGSFRNLGLPVTQFSLRDVANGTIAFMHDGSSLSARFSVKAFDGENQTTQSGCAIVVSTLGDDPPAIGRPHVEVNQSETLSITPEMLSVRDFDSPSTDVVIRIENLQGATFRNIATGAVMKHFTLQQVQDSHIVLSHDGTKIAPAFSVAASDKTNDFFKAIPADVTFHPINGAPRFTGVTAPISYLEDKLVTVYTPTVLDPEGDTVFFSLEGEDLDDFNINASTGVITFKNPPDYENPSDADANNIYTIGIRVSDGILSSLRNVVVAVQDQNDVPAIRNPAITLTEASATVLSRATLGVSDFDNKDQDVTITPSAVAGGVFKKDQLVVTNFTLADVSNGLIRFVHDGVTVAPAFSISARDLLQSTGAAQVAITYIPVDTPPSITSPKFTLKQGASIGITPTILLVVDPDTVDARVTIQVFDLVGGSFQNASAQAITAFTLADVKASQVNFVHDNSSTIPTFKLMASDESNNSDKVSGVVLLDRQDINDAPVVNQPKLTLTEVRGKATVTVTADMIGVQDFDTADASVVVTVGSVAGGVFNKGSSAVTSFSLAEVKAGSISFVHTFNTGAPTFTVSASDGVNPVVGPVNAVVTFTPAAQVIFGDGSGSGASANYSSISGGNGGGDDDTLTGTSLSDVIFGDGSGGGEGLRTGSGGNSNGVGGAAGSGNDTIYGAAGDDLIFGDGFDGQDMNRLAPAMGGYGGGGAGAGSTFESVGGGVSYSAAVKGGSSTLGVISAGGPVIYSNGYNRPGAGGGVSANGSSYGAGWSSTNGNTLQVYDVLTNTVYQRVFNDLQNLNSAIYTQTMGSGGDVIDGGIGNDFIRAGGGDDVIIGGPGSDNLWGNQGADVFRFRAEDLDGATDTIKDFSTAQGDKLNFAFIPAETFYKYIVQRAWSGGTQFVFDKEGLSDFSAPDLTLNVAGTSATLESLMISGNMVLSGPYPTRLVPVFSVTEGKTQVLTPSHLGFSSQANSNTNIEVGNVLAGYFDLVSNPGWAINSFTLQQVKNAQVRFVHNDTELAPFFQMREDSLGIMSAFQDMTPSFTSVNDSPVLGNRSSTIAVDIGNAYLLTAPILGSVSDSDNSDSELIYKVPVSTPNGLSYVRADFLNQPITQFSLREVKENKIYLKVSDTVTPGNLVTYLPVEDALRSSPGSVELNVLARSVQYQRPYISSFVPVFAGATSKVLTTDELVLVGFHTAPEDTRITVLNAPAIQFVHNITGSVLSSFTYDQVLSGAITMNYTDPKIFNSQVLLSVDDMKQLDHSVSYYFDHIYLGIASYVADSVSPVVLVSAGVNTNFSLEQVHISRGGAFSTATPNSYLNNIEHNNSTENIIFNWGAQTSFPITSLPNAARGSYIFYNANENYTPRNEFFLKYAVDYPGQNDAPQLFHAEFMAPFEGVSVLGPRDLQIVDPDSIPADILVQVLKVNHGSLQLLSKPNQKLESFTMQDVYDGKILFVTNGSGLQPSFQIGLSNTGDSKNNYPVPYSVVGRIENNDKNDIFNIRWDDVIGSIKSYALDVDTAPQNVSIKISNLSGYGARTIADVFSWQEALDKNPIVTSAGGGAQATVTITDGTNTVTRDVVLLPAPWDPSPGAGVGLALSFEMNSQNRSRQLINVKNASFSGIISPNMAEFMVSSASSIHVERTSQPGVTVSRFGYKDLATGQLVAVYDGDGSNVPVLALSTISSGTTYPSVMANILFDRVGIPDKPSLKPSLMIGEGQSIVLSSEHLGLRVPDGTTDDLLFTVKRSEGIRIESSAEPGVAIQKFTLGQVNHESIRVVQTGTAYPKLSLSVSDQYNESDVGVFRFSFVKGVRDDPPVFISPSTQMPMQEGGTVFLTKSMLGWSDNDTREDLLSLKVVNVTNGSICFIDPKGLIDNLPVSTFTLKQVNDGRVAIVHDGSETSPTIRIRASDETTGVDASAPVRFNLSNVDDAPIVEKLPYFVVSQGGSQKINLNLLKINDPDTSSADVAITVSSVTGGYFNREDGTVVTSFSLSDVSAERIVFTQDKSSTVPTFAFRVSDGTTTVGPLNGSVALDVLGVDDRPVVLNPVFSLTEARGRTTVSVTADMLKVMDPDTPDASVNISVSNVSGGSFIVSGVSSTNFSLAQLKTGKVTFAHDFRTGTPDFSLSVSDGVNSVVGPVPVQVTFLPSAQIIYGDGSGSGGAASYNSVNGGNGGGDADTLTGTSLSDVIFGDGSGGGEGFRAGWGGSSSGVGGLPGGGNDTINGGDGSDLIFGDGFAGEDVQGAEVSARAGYGGGGAGARNTFESVGGGVSFSTQQVGGSSTVGVASTGGPVVYNNGTNWPGSGGGVSADGTSKGTAGQGVNGNTLQVYDALPNAVYQRVLNDVQDPKSLIYSQAMGLGKDLIDGGPGNDWIHAGGGDDTVIGGKGSDMMWGDLGADIFKFRLEDVDGATDIIKDFSVAEKDKIDFSNIMSALPANTLLSNVLYFTPDFNTGSALVQVDPSGLGSFDRPGLSIFLENVYEWSTLVDFSRSIIV